MSTRTLTEVIPQPRFRHRSLSLALIAVFSSPFLSLPPELIIDILERTLSEAKPTTLATVSKTVKSFIDAILYRKVVLDTPKAVGLFHRTITSKPAAFSASLVKDIAITCSPVSYSCVTDVKLRSLIERIVLSCNGARSISIPTFEQPIQIAPADTRFLSYEGPANLTMQTFAPTVPDTPFASKLPSPTTRSLAPFYGNLGRNLTHLRICEPYEFWVSPRSILEVFGELPRLSHLHLPRRAFANEDNDREFCEDVSALLSARRTPSPLKMLLVSVFPPTWMEAERVRESSVWETLGEIAQVEPERFGLLVGEYGRWSEEWTGKSASMHHDFWNDAWARSKIVPVEKVDDVEVNTTAVVEMEVV